MRNLGLCITHTTLNTAQTPLSSICDGFVGEQQVAEQVVQRHDTSGCCRSVVEGFNFRRLACCELAVGFPLVVQHVAQKIYNKSEQVEFSLLAKFLKKKNCKRRTAGHFGLLRKTRQIRTYTTRHEQQRRKLGYRTRPGRELHFSNRQLRVSDRRDY